MKILTFLKRILNRKPEPSVFDEVELVPLRETKEWNDLFDQLVHWQNLHTVQDHLTITGFFKTIGELEKHVEWVKELAEKNPC